IRRTRRYTLFPYTTLFRSLVAESKVYLIDFDRGKIVPRGRSDRWKSSNIDRLQRSVSKCLSEIEGAARARLWQAFLEGYARAHQDRKSTRLNSSHVKISYA